MSDRIDLLQKIVEQNSKQQEELFRIASKQNGQYVKMEESLQTHFKEDNERFGQQEQDHKEFKEAMKEINAKLDNLKDLSDFLRGMGLMKKPLTMILGFILGTVALLGGIRSLITFFK